MARSARRGWRQLSEPTVTGLGVVDGPVVEHVHAGINLYRAGPEAHPVRTAPLEEPGCQLRRVDDDIQRSPDQSLEWRRPGEVRLPGAGHALHAIFVDDLDALVAQIADRGLEPTKRETYSNGVRKVIYCDPDGNEIGFGGAPR
jgi:hypothetical protein